MVIAEPLPFGAHPGDYPIVVGKKTDEFDRIAWHCAMDDPFEVKGIQY